MPAYTLLSFFFFLLVRRPPRSTLFPTRRSSDLAGAIGKQPYDDDPASSREADRCSSGRQGVGETAISLDRKSTRLNSSHSSISYAVFCLKKKNKNNPDARQEHNTDDHGTDTSRN